MKKYVKKDVSKAQLAKTFADAEKMLKDKHDKEIAVLRTELIQMETKFKLQREAIICIGHRLEEALKRQPEARCGFWKSNKDTSDGKYSEQFLEKLH